MHRVYANFPWLPSKDRIDGHVEYVASIYFVLIGGAAELIHFYCGIRRSIQSYHAVANPGGSREDPQAEPRLQLDAKVRSVQPSIHCSISVAQFQAPCMVAHQLACECPLDRKGS